MKFSRFPISRNSLSFNKVCSFKPKAFDFSLSIFPSQTHSNRIFFSSSPKNLSQQKPEDKKTSPNSKLKELENINWGVDNELDLDLDVNEGEYVNPVTGERGGPRGPEPTRYGDWFF